MPNPVTTCPSCGTRNRVPVAAKGLPRCACCKAELPWLVDAGDSDFDSAVQTRALVLVDLWAPWCGPCRLVAPVLTELSREFAGRVKVVKVNVDDNPALATRYQAQSIPMLLIMDGGQVLQTLVGAHPAPVLRQHITEALASRN